MLAKMDKHPCISACEWVATNLTLAGIYDICVQCLQLYARGCGTLCVLKTFVCAHLCVCVRMCAHVYVRVCVGYQPFPVVSGALRHRCGTGVCCGDRLRSRLRVLRNTYACHCHRRTLRSHAAHIYTTIPTEYTICTIVNIYIVYTSYLNRPHFFAWLNRMGDINHQLDSPLVTDIDLIRYLQTQKGASDERGTNVCKKLAMTHQNIGWNSTTVHEQHAY